jgi:hypothetical protein
VRESIDRVVFFMPRNRELQFAAMTVLQEFVSDFDHKMDMNDSGRTKSKFLLKYDVWMHDTDWRFFLDLGLQFKQEREQVGLDEADMIVDMSDERLAQLVDTGKHAVQVCGLMCGTSCPPIPKLRQVLLSLGVPYRWGWVGEKGLEDAISANGTAGGSRVEALEDVDLMGVQDGQWFGVVGRAGWQTYLACAYGLPVVEIIPQGRPAKWLSKWSHPLYRAVDEVAGDLEFQVEQAKRNLEEVCSHLQAGKQTESILMER